MKSTNTNNTDNILNKINKKNKKDKKEQTTFEKIKSTIITFVVAVVVVMLMHSLILASFIVPTGSMENTVMTGDFLFVHKLFGPSTPQVIPFFNIPLPYKTKKENLFFINTICNINISSF